MVYCTIEEAWTQSPNPELENSSNNHNIPNINYNINGSQDLYEIDPPIEKKRRIPNKSRTYKTLPGHHSGSDRLGKSKIHKLDNKNRIDASIENGIKDGLNDASNDIYSDMTLPENEYNLKLYDEYTRKSNDLKSNGSIMEDFQSDHTIDTKTGNSIQFLEIINELRAENKQLVSQIEELKKSALHGNRENNKDNFMDVVTFITTGIIVILMMENITKLMRKF